MSPQQRVTRGDLVAEELQQAFAAQLGLQQLQGPAGGEQLELVDCLVGVLTGEAYPLLFF